MKRRTLRFALVAALLIGAMGAARPTDFILEVGPMRMIVTDTGAFRQICVGKTQIIGSICIYASASDKSIKLRRLSQISTDVAPLGVNITEDPKTKAAIITRTGALGPTAENKLIGYTERVEISLTGKMTFDYEFEFLKELQWRSNPINVAVRLPMSFAAGKEIRLGDKPGIPVRKDYVKKQDKVKGRFGTFELGGVVVQPGEESWGSVTDERTWGPYTNIYVPIHMKRRWFSGARPLPVGTKFRIQFTVQVPVK